MELCMRSELNLRNVHPDLVRVIRKVAATGGIDFVVTEGLRTQKRQAELFAHGATKTMKSRHLTGHAVDLAVKVAGEVRWDWPLYQKLGGVVKAAAKAEGVAIQWGGDWPTFKDGPHFELTWKEYP